MTSRCFVFKARTRTRTGTVTRTRTMLKSVTQIILFIFFFFDQLIDADTKSPQPQTTGTKLGGDVNNQTTVSVSDEEICHTDLFTATCAQDEVINIESAQYGRLEIGRCVTEDFGNLRCMDDVMPEVTSMCSGRHVCELRVDDKMFKRATACHKDLKSHLWVSYTCMKVVAPSESCLYGGGEEGRALTSPEGLLSSQVTDDTGCGTTDRPWVIQVSSGQRINITLLDFSMEASMSDMLTAVGPGAGVGGGGGGRTCRVYATIRETQTAGRSATVCGAQGRAVNVFLSTTNRVELRVLSTKLSKAEAAAGQQVSQFLFSYKALGCADPVVSTGTRITRVSDVVSGGCEGGGPRGEQSWTMKCVDDQWVGSYENCTNSQATNGVGRTGEVLLPYASSVVITAVIAVIVVCFILIIGVLCIQWRLRKEHSASPYLTTVTSGDPNTAEYDYAARSAILDHRGDKYTVQSHQAMLVGGRGLQPGYPDVTRLHGSQAAGYASGNEYASMRLLQNTPGYSADRTMYCGGMGGGIGGMMAGGYRGSYATDHIYESPENILRGGEDEERRQYTPAHAPHSMIMMTSSTGTQGVTQTDTDRDGAGGFEASCGGVLRDVMILPGGNSRCSGQSCAVGGGSGWRGGGDDVGGVNRMNSYESPSWREGQTASRPSWNNQDSVATNLSGNYSL